MTLSQYFVLASFFTNNNRDSGLRFKAERSSKWRKASSNRFFQSIFLESLQSPGSNATAGLATFSMSVPSILHQALFCWVSGQSHSSRLGSLCMWIFGPAAQCPSFCFDTDNFAEFPNGPLDAFLVGLRIFVFQCRVFLSFHMMFKPEPGMFRQPIGVYVNPVLSVLFRRSPAFVSPLSEPTLAPSLPLTRKGS